MTVEDALDFFSAIPSINNKLKTLMEVGLGYIKLGQQATTLSGGEAQRVKLAKELSNLVLATPFISWMSRLLGYISTMFNYY